MRFRYYVILAMLHEHMRWCVKDREKEQDVASYMFRSDAVALADKLNGISP